jgi:hypothetical protein
MENVGLRPHIKIMNFKEFIEQDQSFLNNFKLFCEENNLEQNNESLVLYNEFLNKIGDTARKVAIGATLPFLMWKAGMAKAGDAPKDTSPADDSKAKISSLEKGSDNKEKQPPGLDPLMGFKNLNKIKATDINKLKMGFKNPGKGVRFAVSPDGKYHKNPFGVKTAFSMDRILKIQQDHPGWVYIPGINMFIDMDENVNNPMQHTLYDAWDYPTPNAKGNFANFFGMQVNDDGSITPR